MFEFVFFVTREYEQERARAIWFSTGFVEEASNGISDRRGPEYVNMLGLFLADSYCVPLLREARRAISQIIYIKYIGMLSLTKVIVYV